MTDYPDNAARPVWPADLPQHFRRTDYAEQAVWPMRRFSPDVGPAITRPAGTARMTAMALSMFCTRDQVRSFERFVWEDLAQGSRAWLGPHPRLDRQCVLRFAADSEALFEIRATTGITWIVSFKVVILEGEV